MHKHTNHQHFNKYDQMKLIACKPTSPKIE